MYDDIEDNLQHPQRQVIYEVANYLKRKKRNISTHCEKEIPDNQTENYSLAQFSYLILVCKKAIQDKPIEQLFLCILNQNQHQDSEDIEKSVFYDKYQKVIKNFEDVQNQMTVFFEGCHKIQQEMIEMANNNTIKDPLRAETIIQILDRLSSQIKIKKEYKNLFVGYVMEGEKTVLMQTFLAKICKYIKKLKVFINYKSKLERKHVQRIIKISQNNFQQHNQKQQSYDYYKQSSQFIYNRVQGQCLFSNRENFQEMELSCIIDELSSEYMQNIQQGQLDDCYFLTALASLSYTHPQIIFGLFVLFKNKSKFYAVRLFIQGKWTTMFIDNWFVYNLQYKKFWYVMQRKDTSIWSMLLEKAYAKAVGSYKYIEFAGNRDGFQALTGAPSIIYHKQQIRQRWDEIERQANIESPILVAVDTHLYQCNQSQIGIHLTPLHSYCVLKIVTVEKVTLIKMLNVSEHTNWNGQWGQKSPKWAQQAEYIEELKDKLGYQTTQSNNIFIMTKQQFIRQVDQVTICDLDNKYTNSYVDVQKIAKNSLVVIQISIQTAGIYIFTANLQGKKKLQSKNLGQLKKIDTHLVLFHKETKTPIKVQTSPAVLGIHKIKNWLKDGNWPNNDYRDYCFRSYGPAPVQMQIEYSKKLANESSYQFAKDCIIKDISSNKRIDFPTDLEINVKLQCFQIGSRGIIYIENQTNQEYHLQIDFQQEHLIVLQVAESPFKQKFTPGQQKRFIFFFASSFTENHIRFRKICLN